MQVVQINDYQKQRFVERMIEAMFNTISGKKITVLGFAFKKARHLTQSHGCAVPALQPQTLHPFHHSQCRYVILSINTPAARCVGTRTL